MAVSRDAIGKALYAALFAVVVPAGLYAWTSRIETGLPAVRAPWLGTSVLAAGATLIVLGMLDLWRFGRGLPMNPYPPPNVVRGGLYGLLPHPIYTGFVACVVGEAIRVGSAAGLWITAPLAALGCLALVLGYEGPKLRERFGPDALPSPWLGVPRGTGPAPLSSRWGTMLWVGAIWGLGYVGIKTLGIPGGGVETRMGWEWRLPVVPGTMWVYASIYLVVPLAFLAAATRARLRNLAAGALIATAVNSWLYVVLPLTAEFRAVPPDGFTGAWLAWEQRMARPAAGSFPSFHATWAVLAAWSLAQEKTGARRAFWAAWGAALSASCLTTGMHSLADVVAGALVGLLTVEPAAAWRRILDWTQALGNSWKSWNLGGLRIMSHGIWSGAAAACGVALVAASAGDRLLGWILAVSAVTVVGSGLFAQVVEGSSALLRPFGYYGAIIGGLLCLLAIEAAGGPAEILVGAFGVAAPFIQGIGRLRCVVQGCCHGRPVDWGIRIVNPHSRVVKLGGLTGTPIHPTPLYSTLGNLAIGMLLVRLWLAGAHALLIAGLYLVLAGLLRFAEEAYRGEPQTRSFGGLPLYQWLAMLSVGVGLVLMIAPSDAVLPGGGISWAGIAGAAAFGLFAAFAMSMDFPGSSARFSRLTG